MSQIISLPYGSETIQLKFKSDVTVYTVDDPVQIADPTVFAEHAKAFLNKTDLDFSSPAAVVADKTRLCGYPQFLPVLLETMIEHGAGSDAITLYIAYGTHMRQSDEESRKAYGQTFDNYKWVHHQCEGDHFVRDGGRLIVLAECRDGIGSSTFLPWFELGGWDDAFHRLAAQYAGNGGTALAMMAKLKRIKISLVTILAPELADLIGFDLISPEQVQGYIDQHTGTMAVIPNAGMLVKQHP